MGAELLDEIQEQMGAIGDVFVAGGRPESVEAAESRLGVRLPASFRGYLERWGNLSVGSIEYYGLTRNDHFDNAAVPNFVWFTLRKREQVGLPSDLVVFLNKDGDEYVCLDTSKMMDDECPVVIWDNVSRAVSEVLECDFAEYLLGELDEFE